MVSVPLTEETRGIVDAAAFAAMRPSAVVVNVGRGPTIDETALFEALRTNRIAGGDRRHVVRLSLRGPADGAAIALPSMSLPMS